MHVKFHTTTLHWVKIIRNSEDCLPGKCGCLMNDESRLKECTRSIANAVHNNEAEVLKVFEFTLRKLHHMFFGNWVLFFLWISWQGVGMCFVLSLCCHYAGVFLWFLDPVMKFWECYILFGTTQCVKFFQFEAWGGCLVRIHVGIINCSRLGACGWLKICKCSMGLTGCLQPWWVLVVTHQNFKVCVFVDWKPFSVYY
jgi:hypothetical protein